MKKIFNHVGLFNDYSQVNPYTYDPKEYVCKVQSKVEAHKEFLKSLSAEENNRLGIIENKTTQLVSQTGIIFSLLSLFIPILIDKVVDFKLAIKIILLIGILLAFLFYMLTIMNALKNFNVKNFVYSYPSPKNVLKFQDDSLESFYAEEVQDLLYSLNQNLRVNNIKASNLLYSYNSFKIANGFMTLSVGILCACLLFVSQNEKPTAKDENLSNETFKSVMHEVENSVRSLKKDTMYIKAGDTLFLKH